MHHLGFPLCPLKSDPPSHPTIPRKVVTFYAVIELFNKLTSHGRTNKRQTNEKQTSF